MNDAARIWVSNDRVNIDTTSILRAAVILGYLCQLDDETRSASSTKVNGSRSVLLIRIRSCAS
jgi:hypothetical protein